jgi:hypothetical protein
MFAHRTRPTPVIPARPGICCIAARRTVLMTVFDEVNSSVWLACGLRHMLRHHTPRLMVADVNLVTGQPCPHNAYLKLQHANEHDVFTRQMASRHPPIKTLSIPDELLQVNLASALLLASAFLGLQDHKTHSYLDIRCPRQRDPTDCRLVHSGPRNAARLSRTSYSASSIPFKKWPKYLAGLQPHQARLPLRLSQRNSISSLSHSVPPVFQDQRARRLGSPSPQARLHALTSPRQKGKGSYREAVHSQPTSNRR